MSSIKQFSIGEIELTTGSTVSLHSGAFTTTPYPSFDVYTTYRVTGSETLSVSDFVINTTGTLDKNIKLIIHWEAVCIPGVNDVIILGETIPQELLSSNFIAICTYNGSSWVVVIIPDWAATSLINSDRIEDSAVITSKISDDAVTLAKMAGLAKGLIIIGDSSGDPSTLNLATDGKILIGDSSTGAATYVLSGDVTMSKGGVVTIGASKVLNAMINSMDASKLTGTVDVARIANDSLGNELLSEITKIDYNTSVVGTSAITTEETLFTSSLAAGLLAADGMGIKITVSGSVAATANAKTIRLRVDNNVISYNKVTTSPNNLKWKIEAFILRSGATSCIATGDFTFSSVASDLDLTTPAITWANAIDVSVTGHNGTAAVNDIVLGPVLIELIK